MNKKFIAVSFLAIICLICFGVIVCANQKYVSVTFSVVVPGSTPLDIPIYVSGDIPELGSMAPNGLVLKEDDDGNYTVTVNLPVGKEIHYRYTRGTKNSFESGVEGENVAMRTITVTEDLKVQEDSVEGWADLSKVPSTLTGNFRYHKDFYSAALGNKRDIIVYLPPSYMTHKKKRYPVLYLHDGNNVFDSKTGFMHNEWKVDETVEKLIAEKKMQEIIMVGIYNTKDRMTDYTNINNEYEGTLYEGKGEAYGDLVVKQIKPFVDKTYRTLSDRKHTGIIGSSLGGLISIHIGYQYPKVFGMVGAMSPSVFWGDKEIVQLVKKKSNTGFDRVWVDMGTAEGLSDDSASYKANEENINDTRILCDAFISKGYKLGKNLEYFEDPGAMHNEEAWSKRMWRPLIFFFGTEK